MITEEMMEHFIRRTHKHIELYGKYIKRLFCKSKIITAPDKVKMLNYAGGHDRSKFETPELEPYVYITWKYYQQKLGTIYKLPADIMLDMLDKATQHHVTNNQHHPEYWQKGSVDIINREDRGKPPAKIINARKMPQLAMAEMVADWMAMAEELGTNPIDWADRNIGIRWEFTEPQKTFIYGLLRERDIWL